MNHQSTSVLAATMAMTSAWAGEQGIEVLLPGQKPATNGAPEYC